MIRLGRHRSESAQFILVHEPYGGKGGCALESLLRAADKRPDG
jgi:hypothetical protein